MAEILDLGTTLLIADIHSFDNSIEVENPVVVASGERVVARVSRLYGLFLQSVQSYNRKAKHAMDFVGMTLVSSDPYTSFDGTIPNIDGNIETDGARKLFSRIHKDLNNAEQAIAKTPIL